MTTAPSPGKHTPRPPMSRETLEARAMQRAHDQHVYIRAIPGQPGYYRTRSKSNPRERYFLVVGPDGILGCSCEGFTRRQSCKHASALQGRLAREAIRSKPEAPALTAADLLYASEGR